MLLTILIVWLAVSMVALLGLAMAARHPSHEDQALPEKRGHDAFGQPIMASGAAASHHITPV